MTGGQTPERGQQLGVTPERGQEPQEQPERYTAGGEGADDRGLQDPDVEED